MFVSGAFEPAAALQQRAMAKALWPILPLQPKETNESEKTRKNNKEEKEGDRPATHDRRGDRQQGSTPSSTLPKGPRQQELMRAGHASSSDQCQQYHEAKLVQCFEQVP